MRTDYELSLDHGGRFRGGRTGKGMTLKAALHSGWDFEEVKRGAAAELPS
jgi:hypothetical protein